MSDMDYADISRSVNGELATVSPFSIVAHLPSPDILVHALTKFVAIPSVSNSPTHKEDCRQAAIWLRKCLTQLGAEASLVSGRIL